MVTPKKAINPQPVIYISEILSSPVGPLWVAVSENGLFAVEFGGSQEAFTQQILRRAPKARLLPGAQQTAQASRQIIEYLEGKRKIFDLEIDLSGLTRFQQEALRATLAIPYGETATYSQIAALLGSPGAARAVGRAEATNPMPLVIPCHRVVGTDGTLHGYGGPGGIELKARLLKLEG